ncbi:hypothetical protein [Enterococcus sp. AZ163]|uniref:hypothetical protein n=1 Tax=Enterococcus sp. AZ163 TaxID=2774638 RepID=UPI003D2A25CA
MREVINSGASDSLNPILLTASTVAFGIIITHTSGFSQISDFLFSSNLPSILKLSLVTIIFGGVTRSASGAEGIVLQSFSGTFVNSGLSSELIHRIVAMSSSILANMPHSGVVLTMLSSTDLNYKTGYKNIVLGFTLVNLVGLLTALLIYFLT